MFGVHKGKIELLCTFLRHIERLVEVLFLDIKLELFEQVLDDELPPPGYTQRMLFSIGLSQTLKACLRLSRLASDSLMTADIYSSMYAQSGHP